MTLKQFIENLEREVKNHSIYVWGGGGQTGATITEAWITLKEKTSKDPAKNAKRAIAFWKEQIAAGYGGVLKAFDCSGLGTYCMGKSKTKANTMMGWCTGINRTQLKKGDWVFRVDKIGDAYHIGYIVDDKLNVIEAMGRDDGVVKRGSTENGTSYWNSFGRPKEFKAEIEGFVPSGVTPVTARNLKLENPMMRGEDVLQLQTALKKLGYNPGALDGVYGNGTNIAVKNYQADKKLTVDGIVGANTRKALGI